LFTVIKIYEKLLIKAIINQIISYIDADHEY